MYGSFDDLQKIKATRTGIESLVFVHTDGELSPTIQTTHYQGHDTLLEVKREILNASRAPQHSTDKNAAHLTECNR